MPPNKLYPLIILLLISFCGQAQTIIPGGYVSGTWDSTGSPYLVQGEITVHDDSSLYILPGVTVNFEGRYLFVVDGYISAIGNESDSIRFTAGSAGWLGMMITSGNSSAGDSLRLSYCVFSAGNQTGTGYGAGAALHIADTDDVSVSHCVFVDNKTSAIGGALYLRDANILCRDSRFFENHCSESYGSVGGAAYIYYSNPIFSNVVFDQNYAANGGAVCSQISSPLFYSCSFQNNLSIEDGGAIVFRKYAYSIFEDCFFENNQSLENGGAIEYSDSGNLIILNCIFENNFSEYRGGAIYLETPEVSIQNSSFENNSTGEELGFSKGGAIYIKDADQYLLNVDFQYNESLVAGALYSDNSSMDIEACTFQNNMSQAGGGAFVCHNSGVMDIENCLFENNHANGSGGAIAFLEGMQAQLLNCTITDNTSESEIYLADGGGVLITPYDNEVSFVNCNISWNWAEDFGGGLYTASPTQLIGCLFHGNMMPCLQESRGGAITLGETSMQVINTTFVDNYALIGTTIYCEDAELAMINTILWDTPGVDESKIFLSTNVNPPALFVDHSNIQGGMNYISGSGGYIVNWASGNINEIPHFMLPGEDFSLAWNSPCINAGRSDTLFLLIPPEDIAGNPRIMGGEIDMGCYEYQGPISIPEISIEQEFLVYPNPAGDYIYLKSETEIDFIGNLILTDFSGRILLNRKINISSGELIRQTLKGLPSGFYILNLLSNEHSYAKKLIIK
ncbi:T9SS type A sorting domain-containing protein [bacterium]|nr:T9SS type A sorting domain-containing protein [bacterium]